MKQGEEDNEVDKLIEFAYDLDYEKYVEDFEVRQALEIMKQRIDEMKQDEEWKKKIADEWNEIAEQEEADKRDRRIANDDAQSQASRCKTILW